ncbi:MAG: hypothetical protein IKE31_03760 [Eubacterium sp.]|nr:hypothetical protein [Eubacterium sp.]
MRQKITLAAVLIGLFLMWGTAGALEMDTITITQAAVRIALILAGMIAAIKIGRLTEGCE